nr:MAG TPA: hypothetical protein [Inoviridae sp.]
MLAKAVVRYERADHYQSVGISSRRQGKAKRPRQRLTCKDS